MGLTAAQAVGLLPTLLPDVARYTFLRYTPSAGVDLRIRQGADRESVSELERLKSAAPQLFEGIAGLSGLVSALSDPTKATLTEMLRHDDSAEMSRELSIDAATLRRGGLASLLSELSPSEAIGLCSTVALNNGESAHLPLLDFSIPPSHSNCKLVENAAQLLGFPHALVVESGRSYHLYGLGFLVQEAWIKFLARALLLAPLVDVRYVAHRLLAGHAVLRINATLNKPVEPHVVAEL